MKYNLITIKPDFKNNWTVSISKDSTDRVDNHQVKPNPNGFFYYPHDSDPQKAFDELKIVILESHQKEIKRITDSMAALKSFELENKPAKRSPKKSVKVENTL